MKPISYRLVNRNAINISLSYLWKCRLGLSEKEKEITRERPGERHEKNPNKEMKNYNSKKEDLEEEDQRQDERNVIL